MRTILDLLTFYKSALRVEKITDQNPKEEYHSVEYEGFLPQPEFGVFNEFKIREFQKRRTVVVFLKGNIDFKKSGMVINPIVEYLGEDMNGNGAFFVLPGESGFRYYDYKLNGEFNFEETEQDEAYGFSVSFSKHLKSCELIITHYEYLMDKYKLEKNW